MFDLCNEYVLAKQKIWLKNKYFKYNINASFSFFLSFIFINKLQIYWCIYLFINLQFVSVNQNSKSNLFIGEKVKIYGTDVIIIVLCYVRTRTWLSVWSNIIF